MIFYKTKLIMDTLERIHELITRAKRIGLTGVEVTITDTFNYLFLHECSEKENTVLRNFFPDLDKMEAFLETYQVGDKPRSRASGTSSSGCSIRPVPCRSTLASRASAC